MLHLRRLIGRCKSLIVFVVVVFSFFLHIASSDGCFASLLWHYISHLLYIDGPSNIYIAKWEKREHTTQIRLGLSKSWLYTFNKVGKKPVFYLFFVQLRFFWYARHDKPYDWFQCNEQIFNININSYWIIHLHRTILYIYMSVYAYTRTHTSRNVV